MRPARPAQRAGGRRRRRRGTRRAAERGGAFLPLRHAARAFDLRPEEYDALLLALSVELDGRIGRLVAYLNDHVARTRPTVGLALNFGASNGQSRPAAPSPLAFCERPAVRDGLLELEGDGPLPGLALRVPRDLAARLTGDAAPGAAPPGVEYFPPEPGRLARLVLADPVRAKLAAVAERLRDDRRDAPVTGADERDDHAERDGRARRSS